MAEDQQPAPPTTTVQQDLTTAGQRHIDSSMAFLRQIANANGHKGTARDAAGRECLIWTNSNENPVTLPAYPNGIVLIDLATGNQTGLLSLDWSLAVHISARPGLPFCGVETYAAASITPAAGWAAYTNEILRVWLDGTPPDRLAHHRSQQPTSGSYNAEPLLTLSRDGTRWMFRSNFNQRPTDPEYCDVYSITLAAPLPSLQAQITALAARVTALEAKL